jgi:molybdopterin converting factor small subunit
MKIRVNFPGILVEGQKLDSCELTLREPTTVHDAVEDLVNRFGTSFKEDIFQQDGMVSPMIALLVNGQNVHLLEGLATQLSNGDCLDIMHIIAGGD